MAVACPCPNPEQLVFRPCRQSTAPDLCTCTMCPHTHTAYHGGRYAGAGIVWPETAKRADAVLGIPLFVSPAPKDDRTRRHHMIADVDEI